MSLISETLTRHNLMKPIFSAQLQSEQPLATRILQRGVAENKLAKAYLLAGHATPAKWKLTFELGAYLNCLNVKDGQSQSCLILEPELNTWCINCRWIKEDKHPQAIMRLVGNNKSGKIAVEEARNFVGEIAKSSPYFRLLIIEQANQDILHRPAANTLLKTIEEPRSQILMIFFALSAADVLSTIVSRCQTINMASQQYAQSLSLLSNNVESQLVLLDKEQRQSISSSIDLFIQKNNNFSAVNGLIEVIQSLLKDGIELENILDYCIAKDLQNANNRLDKENTQYIKELFLIGQIAKEQAKHYVSEKALIETFVYAWHRLKTTGSNPLKVHS